MIDNFKAYVVREGKNGIFSGQIETKKFDDLPPNEITIKVKYSSLNYKDALSSIGNKGVTRPLDIIVSHLVAYQHAAILISSLRPRPLIVFSTQKIDHASVNALDP